MLTLHWPHQTSFWLAALERWINTVQLSGSRLQPHWATSHFDTWSVHLASGLLHYSTSHASTVLLMATELLYNTNNTDWCLLIGFVCCSYFNLDIDAYRPGFAESYCPHRHIISTYYITISSLGANFDSHIRKHYTFCFIRSAAKILYNSSMAFVTLIFAA